MACASGDILLRAPPAARHNNRLRVALRIFYRRIEPSRERVRRLFALQSRAEHQHRVRVFGRDGICRRPHHNAGYGKNADEE